MHRFSQFVILILFVFLFIETDVDARDISVIDITQLSIEQLMNTDVRSVSKSPHPFFDSPAAVFVITQDDIRRSGATNIAEALRMVPGLHVARVDANKWAISARGFNSRFANKLLVLFDGHPVYTPTFSGTHWETLDPVMSDIERIEVIRDPGPASGVQMLSTGLLIFSPSILRRRRVVCSV